MEPMIFMNEGEKISQNQTSTSTQITSGEAFFLSESTRLIGLDSEQSVYIDPVLDKNGAAAQKLSNNVVPTKSMNQEWLIESINYYMLLLSVVLPDYTRQKFATLNTVLFDLYLKGNYINVSPTMGVINFNDYNKLLIPILYLKHWSLIVIDRKLNIINYYDFEGNSQERLEIIKSFIYGIIANYTDIQLLQFINQDISVHHQADADACGYFTCAYAKRICLDLCTNFDAYHIDDIKNEILDEIRNDNISGLKILKHHLSDNLISIKSRVLNLKQAKSQISNKTDIEQGRKGI